MSNPFTSVPLNTDRCYIKGIARSGCEIYVPILVRSKIIEELKQQNLQAWLDNQPPLQTTTEPERA